MANITIEPIGLEMESLRADGCNLEVGGCVVIEFKEVIEGREEGTIKVHLTANEAVNIMGSIAMFLGYDFVKKEGV